MKIKSPIFGFGEYGDLAWFSTVEEAASFLEPAGLEEAISCDSEGRQVNYLVKPHSTGSWYNGKVLFGNIESEPTLEKR